MWSVQWHCVTRSPNRGTLASPFPRYPFTWDLYCCLIVCTLTVWSYRREFSCNLSFCYAMCLYDKRRDCNVALSGTPLHSINPDSPLKRQFIYLSCDYCTTCARFRTSLSLDPLFRWRQLLLFDADSKSGITASLILPFLDCSTLKEKSVCLYQTENTLFVPSTLFILCSFSLWIFYLNATPIPRFHHELCSC